MASSTGPIAGIEWSRARLSAALRPRLDQPPHTDAGAFYTAPSKMVGEFVRRVSGTRTPARRYLIIVPAAGLVALALVLWKGTTDLRASAVTAWLMAAVLLLVALAFAYRYEVYALAQLRASQAEHRQLAGV